MKYKIEFTKQPIKYFQKLDLKSLKLIKEKLILFSLWEFNKLDIKILLPKNVNKYRLRV